LERDVIVIGASAGGVDAVSRLLEGLPRTLPAAVFVVVHIPADPASRLAEVLGRHTTLEVIRPTDRESIRDGRVYVAVSDRHLMLEEDRVRVVHGPKEHRHRPSIDVLFRSAAEQAGERVVGVLLTGADADGAAGLAAIKAKGGMAVVQDPEDAAFPDMPGSALGRVDVDYRLRLAEIAPRLVDLTS